MEKMQNLYIYPLVCAIILVIFGNFWEQLSSELSEPSVVELIPVTSESDYDGIITTMAVQVEHIKQDEVQSEEKNSEKSENSENSEISEKMERKRKILERGCSMMHSLFEMSQNGTSYEDLLTWHSRIHDLNYPLADHRAPNEKCFPPLQLPDVNLILYQVPKKIHPISTALFCLPPKCGTTSYQRALVQHITHLMSQKSCNGNSCFSRYFVKNLKQNLMQVFKSLLARSSYIDVVDGCWRRNVLVTILKCW